MILDYKKIMDQNLDFFDDFFTNLPDSHHTKSQTGEHYKLLKYISNLYDDITILDLGTNTGESAIALSQNKKNKVITYDIENKLNIDLKSESNIEVKLLDINSEDINILKSAKVISLDISHDGLQEKAFTDLLERIGYEGYLICDDIHNIYYPNMNPWWESLNIEKYDVTKVGHHWGTGIVNYYKDNSIKIIDNI
jgi:hypothetical protein